MAKLLAVFMLSIVAIKMAAITPRETPVITLDANEHTITQQIYCDGNNVTSIETFIDGVYLMTTLLPPPAPTGLKSM